jgi:hypothetical protein
MVSSVMYVGDGALEDDGLEDDGPPYPPLSVDGDEELTAAGPRGVVDPPEPSVVGPPYPLEGAAPPPPPPPPP